MNVDKKRNNKVTVMGTLLEIERIEGTTKTGVPFLRGKATIAANDDKYIVEYFAGKNYNNGNENPQYDVIGKLNLNSLVKVTGNLEGNRFHGADDKLVVTNRIRVSFFNDPYESDTPGAIFDFSGFVTKELTEVRDEKDNLVSYSMQIAQSKYKPEEGLDVITFHVDPNNTAAVNGIRATYLLGKTVRPTGRIKSKIVTTEVREAAVFGEDNVRVFQKNIVEFLIDSGLTVDELEVYTEQEIATLLANTETNDARLLSEKKNRASNKATPAAGFASASPAGNDAPSANALLGL